MSDTQDLVLLDDEITPHLLKIVGEARQHVTLVTPYIALWGHLKSAIQRAVVKGVKVTVLLRRDGEKVGGDGDDAKASVSWLVENGVAVYSLERLHAKVYLNEHSLLVSSMNLTESSATNSSELALLLSGSQAAPRIREYVQRRLLERASPILLARQGTPQVAVREPKAVYTPVTRGACIRCGRALFFDPSKPLCDDCYGEWAKWENEEYEEKFCHECGKPEATCYARPLCGSCYRRTG